MTAVFAANAQPIVRVLTSEASRANAGKPASIWPYPTNVPMKVSSSSQAIAGWRRIWRYDVGMPVVSSGFSARACTWRSGPSSSTTGISRDAASPR